MKLYNIKDVDGFFDLVNSCKGTVELVSKEGDRLNLKSKLCQFIALSTMFGDETMIKELELIAHEPEDMKKLFSFVSDGR